MAYKGKINEFVDWISGYNELTESQIQEVNSSNPISGESIRKLIQKHLKVPFVTNDDDSEKDRIYFFSSEEAKNLWKLYSKLDSPLYNLEKADSLVLYSMDLPATYTVTGLDSFILPRYIIEGNTNSENATLDYTLGIRDALGGDDSDILTLTYTIEDSSGNTNYNESVLVATGVRTRKNIYQYLKSGDNTVTLKAIANNHSALISKVFHIYLVKFSIDSNFTGYYNGVSNGVPISFDISVNRSITNLPVIVKVFVDNIMDETNPAYTWTYTDSGANPSRKIELPNNYQASDYEGNHKHTLLIRGIMEDPESGSIFRSNVLMYEFEVRSSLGDLTNRFINYTYSVPNASYLPLEEEGKVVLQVTQYVPFTLNWGYYSDGGFELANITWAIRTGPQGDYVYNEIVSILGISGVKPDTLSFIVSNSYLYENDYSVLVARINGVDIEEIPINVIENTISVNEKENYSLKLSAYGKTNSSITKDEWIDYENSVTTTFLNVSFDNNLGWDNNSLILRGTNSKAIINYCPFPSQYSDAPYEITREGATFEIDFKPEYVNNDNDIILSIGNTSGSHIRITPNSAAYYEGGSAIVKTNFKSGERIKLAFIFNRQSDLTNSSNLVYIVNNGILERAAARGIANIVDDNSKIVIGGSESSIRVYMIRAYRRDITPKEALDNYMFDNIDDSALISRNDIYKNSDSVTYNGLLGKQDLIIIEGNLSDILRNASAKKNATVDIRRESNTQSNKNFTVTNCRIRNHGLSTLSYPITSMKIWFNKSNKFVPMIDGIGNTVLQEITPTFNCQSLSYLGLAKNRYMMKDTSIPSNKFVLQANYADSSGAHNGSLLRLILDTWYNAQIDGEFKLRTAPLLFTSGMHITHNNPNLNEDGSWIEGVCNIPTSIHNGKTWSEISGLSFPYNIRVAPDSFPCTVFYRDTSTDSRELTLLGQYVFMDDKKSDYVYGERSIYYTDDPSDPFCLKSENSKKDKKANKVWDNDDVLLIEVVYPNSPLTSYSEKIVSDTYVLDENDVLIPSGVTHRFDDALSYDSNNIPTEYYWELHFEMIYPDKEDILDDNNNFDATAFALKAQPFVYFLEWITDVGALRDTGSKLGLTGSEARVTQAELNKFISEAHNHLDLYKLAAYYIFFLRFGLVDSVERNAQLKTYDGQHWHYEPWDMDIALGCANNGVIAYNPPIDRNTKAGGDTYAFSGRTATLSNVLWDCLECWDYWANTIVPEVAQALYKAGLTYDNASKMFDKEYVEKWSETLYNESGQYKYIDATSDGNYRRYLNGARTSHRHWWLSTSMNYYDAKWSCGDFANHAIEIRISKSSDITGNNIVKIYPTNNTFFKAQYGSTGDLVVTILGNGLTEATIEHEAQIDFNIQLDDKLPTFIFGANSIEGLDLSNLLINSTNNIGRGYMDIKLSGAYDSVLGARLKTLKLGAPCTPNLYTNPNEVQYSSNLTVGQNAIISSSEGHDALENLELLDVVGWYSKLVERPGGSWLSEIVSGKLNLYIVYAMGCNTVTEFSSSSTGNLFRDLRLPSTVRTLQFTNSTWNNLSFWETTDLTSTSAQYNKISIPSTIDTIILSGTTARNECSLNLILEWINNIDLSLFVGHTEQDLLDELSTNYTLQAEQINWGNGTTKLYYRDVVRLGHFKKGSMTYNLKGYVVISDLDNLTAVQLTELENLFGNNVFNIGTVNTNLVVDLNKGFVRISSNASIDLNELALLLSEPNDISLTATKFTLTSNLSLNLIVSTSNNYNSLLESRNSNVYLWGLSLSQPQTVQDHSNTLPTINSCSLELKFNGGIKLLSSEGDYGNYSVWVTVYYYDEINNTINSDSVKVKVTGVTYPTDFVFNTFGVSSPREFLYTSDIARNLFNSTIALLQTLPKAYVMFTDNLEIEFYINRGSGYTATINSIRYYLEDLSNSAYNTGNLLSTELGSGDSTLYYIEPSDIHIAYSKDATKGGIKLKVISCSLEIKTYRLSAAISIGGKGIILRSILIMLYNDGNIIVPLGLSNLYTVLQSKYRTLYSVPSWERSFYKSDLISLYGTLDFSSTTSISSIMTTQGDTILKYIPNITSLVFDGCTLLLKLDPSTMTDSFDFSALTELTSVSMNGCSGVIGILNFNSNVKLETLDIRNTTLGVILPQLSNIRTLLLGSPTKVDITNPKYLTDSGITILSKVNLEDISLINVNMGDLSNPAQGKGFNIFNILYV